MSFSNYKMLKINKLVLFFIVAFLLFSCEKAEKITDKEVPKEMPKALKDEKSITDYAKSSRGYDNDLVEELYNELVEKTPILKKLEDDIQVVKEKQGRNNVNNEWNNYARKSINYYSAVQRNANQITDSLLKTKILLFLTNSKNYHTKNTVEFDALQQIITQKSTTINNQHIILKILLTIPIIDKYQKEHLPTKTTHQNLINEQNKIIQKIDSLTPKY